MRTFGQFPQNNLFQLAFRKNPNKLTLNFDSCYFCIYRSWSVFISPACVCVYLNVGVLAGPEAQWTEQHAGALQTEAAHSALRGRRRPLPVLQRPHPRAGVLSHPQTWETNQETVNGSTLRAHLKNKENIKWLQGLMIIHLTCNLFISTHCTVLFVENYRRRRSDWQFCEPRAMLDDEETSSTTTCCRYTPPTSAMSSPCLSGH